ncbi:hypothetical protein CHCC5025_1998 [Bacillus licheniformis]|nr:hypothetical protein CHCC5025_1998 [Bacillus licheniformis]
MLFSFFILYNNVSPPPFIVFFMIGNYMSILGFTHIYNKIVRFIF